MPKKVQFPGLVTRKPSLKLSSLGSSGGSTSSRSGGSAGRLPPMHELKISSFSTRSLVAGINFGRPSSSAGANGSNASSAGANLLTSLVSGGPGGLLAGLLSPVSLVSDFKSLFGGGKKAPPPLVEFRLPGSMSNTLTIGSARSGVPASNAVTQEAVAPQPLMPVGPSLSSQVLNIVKQGLLKSAGGLADVIGEL